eukprot:EG_transcript_18528
MTPSTAGAKHNITVGAGEKDPIGTLLVLGGVSAALVGGGQALGSAALAAAAYLPGLAINYNGMKPRTREQLLSVLILWLSWSVFGALVAVVLSLGFLHWGWGSLLPCLVILTVMVRSKPEVPDFAFQRWVVPLLWDPPILAALAICDWFDLTLLHDGHGHYLSVVDDNICIASLPSVFRVPELEAAKVGSVINMCYGRAVCPTPGSGMAFLQADFDVFRDHFLSANVVLDRCVHDKRSLNNKMVGLPYGWEWPISQAAYLRPVWGTLLRGPQRAGLCFPRQQYHRWAASTRPVLGLPPSHFPTGSPGPRRAAPPLPTSSAALCSCGFPLWTPPPPPWPTSRPG